MKRKLLFSLAVLYVGSQLWGHVDAFAQTVYIAGYYTNSEDKTLACYWKDGLRQPLDFTGIANNSRAYAITVSGGSVYVAGFYNDSFYNQFACYWKDGVRQLLDHTRIERGVMGDAYASAITVSGGSVYVAGMYFVRSGGGEAAYEAGTYYVDLDSVACYWKDGVRQGLELPYRNGYYYTESIAVGGSTVCVSGYFIDPEYKKIPCFWIDGRLQRSYFQGVIGDTRAYSIALLNSNIYVAGHYSQGALEAACYWLNGRRQVLELFDEEYSQSQALSIAVTDSSVYMAGWYTDPSYYQFNRSSSNHNACYWKDGKLQIIDLGIAADYSFTSSIAVTGSSVYIAGYYHADRKDFAYYWKDGVRQPLDLTGMTGSNACSIVVVR